MPSLSPRRCKTQGPAGRIHLVPSARQVALCGLRPGELEEWSDPEAQTATCRRCLVLEKILHLVEAASPAPYQTSEKAERHRLRHLAKLALLSGDVDGWTLPHKPTAPPAADPVEAAPAMATDYVSFRPSRRAQRRLTGTVTGTSFQAEIQGADEAVHVVPVASPLRPAPKAPPPVRSMAYLDFVRRWCCLLCDAPALPVDAHHVGRHPIGQRVSDLFAVPLCRRCHDHLHSTGALPGYSPEDTHDLLRGAIIVLLAEWHEELMRLLLPPAARALSPEERAYVDYLSTGEVVHGHA